MITIGDCIEVMIAAVLTGATLEDPESGETFSVEEQESQMATIFRYGKEALGITSPVTAKFCLRVLRTPDATEEEREYAIGTLRMVLASGVFAQLVRGVDSDRVDPGLN